MQFCKYEMNVLTKPKHREIEDIQELVNKHGKVKGISLCIIKNKSNTFSISAWDESNKHKSYKRSISINTYGFEKAYEMSVEIICKSYGILKESKDYKYLLSLIKNYK